MNNTEQAKRERELLRIAENAATEAAYWQERYNSLARDVRGYFQSKKMLRREAKQLASITEE